MSDERLASSLCGGEADFNAVVRNLWMVGEQSGKEGKEFAGDTMEWKRVAHGVEELGH